MPARPDLHVLARLLAALHREDGWTRSTLQAAARLNYTLFARYLDDLERRGWVRIEPRENASDRIHLTDEGRTAWLGLGAWLERFFRDSRL